MATVTYHGMLWHITHSWPLLHTLIGSAIDTHYWSLLHTLVCSGIDKHYWPLLYTIVGSSIDTHYWPLLHTMSVMFLTFFLYHYLKKNVIHKIIIQGFQSADSIHAINLLTSGLFTVNTMIEMYWAKCKQSKSHTSLTTLCSSFLLSYSNQVMT